MKYLVLILIAVQSSLSFAGVGAHGGNVVNCQSQPAVTLDYYNAGLPTLNSPAELADLSGMSEEEAFQFVRSRFDGSPVQSTFDLWDRELGPMSSWIATDLKSIDDSNEPYALPSTCTRMTGAARQGNLVYIDPYVYSILSPGQRGLLHAHEVLYALSGLDTSGPIRDLFRVMLNKNFDRDLMNKRVKALGQVYLGWDYMTDRATWVYTKDPAVKFDFNSLILDQVAKSNGFSAVILENYSDMASNVQLGLDCKIETGACQVNGFRGPLSYSYLKGCVINWPTPTTLTLQCSAFGASPLTFVRH